MGKKYDICAVKGTYTNKEGKTRNEYLNVGVVMEKEGREFILLERTFNPAGLPNPDNRSNVLLSLFEPKEKGQAQPQSKSYDSTPAHNDVDDDEIPF